MIGCSVCETGMLVACNKSGRCTYKFHTRFVIRLTSSKYQDCPRKFGNRPRRDRWWQTHSVAPNNRSAVFSRWRQCARPPNTRFLLPTQLTIPNGILIVSAVFCMADAILSLYVSLRHPISPRNSRAYHDPTDPTNPIRAIK